MTTSPPAVTQMTSAGCSPVNQPVSDYWVVGVLHLLSTAVGNTDSWRGKSMRQTFWSVYKGATGDLWRLKWDFWRIGLVNKRRPVGSCFWVTCRECWLAGRSTRPCAAHIDPRLASFCGKVKPAARFYLIGLLVKPNNWSVVTAAARSYSHTQTHTSVKDHGPHPSGNSYWALQKQESHIFRSSSLKLSVQFCLFVM